MARLFVALRPPAGHRTGLNAIMEGVPGARWQDDEQLHLTLRFLGEVDRHQAADVDAALASVRAAPVVLGIAGVGCFDRAGRPESLWAGVRPHATLLHLHRAVDRAMVQVGFAPEQRAFRPHVTVARCGRRGCPAEPWLGRHAGLAMAAATLDSFLLFESTLGGEGARYAAIGRYRLT